MKWYLVILFALNSLLLFSQDNTHNEAKYWVWRDRLVNDWMVPNYTADYAHQGRGIIFGSRGDSWWQDLNYQNEVTSYSGGFDINDEGFQMGKYLIVLATEWRLLYNSGLPTKQTEAEIYWALKTIDRLDFYAAHYWSYFWTKDADFWSGNLDGFMIRDDVFTNFLWYNTNYPTPENNLDNDYFNFFSNYYSGNKPPFLNFNSDAYENYRYLNQGYDGNRGKYINQNIMLCNIEKDTIYDLRELMKKTRYTHYLNGHFMEFNNDFPYIHITEPYGINSHYYPINGGFSGAMAGLYACFDDYQGGANYNRSSFRDHHWTGPEEYSQDNYIGLLQGLVTVQKLVTSDGLSSYAQGIIKRIISSIKENNSFNNNWIIDNPETGLCDKGVFWEKVVDDVIDGGYHSGHLDGACNQGGAEAGMYSGQFAKIYENYVGGNFNGQIINGVIGSDNALLSAILVTMSGYLPSNVIGLFQTTEEKLKTINKKCCKDWIDHDESSSNKTEFQYLDLLFCYLHGLTEPYRGFQHYYDILNSTICPDNERLGNLLSEMIVHNLIKLIKGESYSYKIFETYDYPIIEYFPHWIQHISYQNYDSTNVWPGIDYLAQNLPYDEINYYQIIPHCTITRDALFFIESTSVISSYNGDTLNNNNFNVPVIHGSPCTADVTYRAGKEIHLKPGFKVINGAKFHGYIESIAGTCLPKEGNSDVAVLFYPPSNEHLSPFVSNLNFTKSSLNDSIEIKAINNDIQIEYKIVPNPAKDYINVISSCQQNILIEVFNIMGIPIENITCSTNEDIPIKNISNGIYIIKIYNGNELKSIQKIIIQ
jgi:hypothetical protein